MKYLFFYKYEEEGYLIIMRFRKVSTEACLEFVYSHKKRKDLI